MSAVGLHRYSLVCGGFQITDKLVGDEQRGFATRKHYQRCLWIGIDGIGNLLRRHHRARGVSRVAKRAGKVAATEAHKHAWHPCVEALALKRIEYFVDFILLHD